MDLADTTEFEVGRCPSLLPEERNQPSSKVKGIRRTSVFFFYDKPVHLLVTDTSHIWEEAERVNRAALEIFGRGSSQVAAGDASSLVPPASPPAKSQPAKMSGSHLLRRGGICGLHQREPLSTSSPEGTRAGSPLFSSSPEGTRAGSPLFSSSPEGARAGSPLFTRGDPGGFASLHVFARGGPGGLGQACLFPLLL